VVGSCEHSALDMNVVDERRCTRVCLKCIREGTDEEEDGDKKLVDGLAWYASAI